MAPNSSDLDSHLKTSRDYETTMEVFSEVSSDHVANKSTSNSVDKEFTPETSSGTDIASSVTTNDTQTDPG